MSDSKENPINVFAADSASASSEEGVLLAILDQMTFENALIWCDSAKDSPQHIARVEKRLAEAKLEARRLPLLPGGGSASDAKQASLLTLCTTDDNPARGAYDLVISCCIQPRTTKSAEWRKRFEVALSKEEKTKNTLVVILSTKHSGKVFKEACAALDALGVGTMAALQMGCLEENGKS